MPNHVPLSTDQALIAQYVGELVQLAKGQYPEVSIDILPTPFEDEDAHILVYLPEEAGEAERDRLSDALTGRGAEILLETGLLILIGVYEAAQRPQPSEG